MLKGFSVRFGSGRRTSRSSKQLSSGCGCLFFGLFFLIGSSFLVLFVHQMFVPVWRANNVYVEGACVVLDKRIGESKGDDGTTYRPEIRIKLTVNGRDYESWTWDAAGVYSGGRAQKQAIIDQYTVGQEYPCWYDPDDPHKAVLVRGYSWFLLIALVPLVFIAVGLAGMIYSLKSGAANRRRTRLVSADELRSTDFADTAEEYPHVPTLDLSDSPGTTLAVRLSGTKPSHLLFGLLAVAVFWNGITWLFVGLIISGKGPPEHRGFLGCFMTPFVLVGLVLVFAFFRQLLVTTGVGATVAEISRHPVRAGEPCRVYVSQSGNLQMNSLRLLLVCEEEARYRQGTSTRTDTKRVYEAELLRQQGFEIHKGLPHEVRCELRVPRDAMHSFEAGNNHVNWKLLVAGDVAGWPNFERDYPLVVLPAGRSEVPS